MLFIRVRKILNLRLFEDENGRAWSRSVMDRELEVLCVSQFTLQCILKGNKPDFHCAMPADLSQPFYNRILEQLREAYKPELIKGEAHQLTVEGFILDSSGNYILHTYVIPNL